MVSFGLCPSYLHLGPHRYQVAKELTEFLNHAAAGEIAHFDHQALTPTLNSLLPELFHCLAAIFAFATFNVV
jgi:hypothetical protein